MRAVAKIDQKQIAAMTLDITLRMTVDEWRELMRQQSDSWPATTKPTSRKWWKP